MNYSIYSIFIKYDKNKLFTPFLSVSNIRVPSTGLAISTAKLKENISKVLREIPKEKYTNMFKGAYNRDTTYVKKTSRMTRKLKNYKV